MSAFPGRVAGSACTSTFSRSHDVLWVAIDLASKCGSLPSILELTMNVGADKSELLTAIRTDLGAIFISLELSRSSLLITSLSPGGG